MGTYRYGDLRDETYLLRSVLHSEPGAFAARQPRLRHTRPRQGRARARIWLGTVLLSAGQRLLRSIPTPIGPA